MIMASPGELSLDVKPHSYSLLLKSFHGGDQNINNDGDDDQQQQQNQMIKLEDFLARLEEEKLKIDAFKRELPLCMQLLSNAMEALRQQLQSYRANQGPRPSPVLEEFIPVKQLSSDAGSEKARNMAEKVSWMTSAQLWSDGIIKQALPTPAGQFESENEISFSISTPNLDSNNKQQQQQQQRIINGGAFHPFSKERSSCPSPNSQIRALPDLALSNSNLSDQREMEDRKLGAAESGAAVADHQQGKGGNNPAEGQTAATTTAGNSNSSHRKARRCWSPDLHRRFVNALQMLGGSQVATPKQIRELMKVDGLTNDEVKSHLQKYRLHTRRPSPSPQAAGGAAPQLVVLGGIWVPTEYAAAAAHGYGGHPGGSGPHYCAAAAPMPQEFYPALPAHNHHHHHHHQQLHVYKATSPDNNSSPDSGVGGAAGGGGDRSESIEDGKSESSSWKGDSSGENGGGEQRKGLMGLRQGGGHEDQSHGSEISLRF